MKNENNQQKTTDARDETPLLSYSRLDEKPLLANQSAINHAVELLGMDRHDRKIVMKDFQADDKFKKHWEKEHGKQPDQDQVNDYVLNLIQECQDEDEANEKTRLKISHEKNQKNS